MIKQKLKYRKRYLNTKKRSCHFLGELPNITGEKTQRKLINTIFIRIVYIITSLKHFVVGVVYAFEELRKCI